MFIRLAVGFTALFLCLECNASQSGAGYSYNMNNSPSVIYSGGYSRTRARNSFVSKIESATEEIKNAVTRYQGILEFMRTMRKFIMSYHYDGDMGIEDDRDYMQYVRLKILERNLLNYLIDVMNWVTEKAEGHYMTTFNNLPPDNSQFINPMTAKQVQITPVSSSVGVTQSTDPYVLGYKGDEMPMLTYGVIKTSSIYNDYKERVSGEVLQQADWFERVVVNGENGQVARQYEAVKLMSSNALKPGIKYKVHVQCNKTGEFYHYKLTPANKSALAGKFEISPDRIFVLRDYFECSEPNGLLNGPFYIARSRIMFQVGGTEVGRHVHYQAHKYFIEDNSRALNEYHGPVPPHHNNRVFFMRAVFSDYALLVMTLNFGSDGESRYKRNT